MSLTNILKREYYPIVKVQRLRLPYNEIVQKNLQNIPTKGGFRETFNFNHNDNIKLIVADYSNQELAILADKANEGRMIDAINNRRDLHETTSKLIFGDKIKK